MTMNGNGCCKYFEKKNAAFSFLLLIEPAKKQSVHYVRNIIYAQRYLDTFAVLRASILQRRLCTRSWSVAL